MVLKGLNKCKIKNEISQLLLLKYGHEYRHEHKERTELFIRKIKLIIKQCYLIIKQCYLIVLSVEKKKVPKVVKTKKHKIDAFIKLLFASVKNQDLLKNKKQKGC